MSTDDDKSKASKDGLLDELESIQNLLIKDSDSDNEGAESFVFAQLDSDELENDVFDGVELELDLDNDLNIDIPILDDVVDQTGEQEDDHDSGLLNLEEIFDQTPPNPSPSLSSDKLPSYADDGDIRQTDGQSVLNVKTTREPHDEVNIEFLIQELVDEFIPMIEDQLRVRLSQIHPDIIRELADKYFK